MLGRAAVAMWWDVVPDMQAEFEHWHTHEHMPERLSIPGFLRGTRWIALSGEPSYFVLYEVKSLAVLNTGRYLERLNDPTPWSRKILPHHRNMMRSLCRVRATFGAGLPHALATLRFSPAPRKARTLERWLGDETLPAFPQREGLTGAHLLASERMGGRPQTAEQKIRAPDLAADWVLLVGGYSADAVRGVAAGELSEGSLAAHGAAPGLVAGFYRPSYSLTPRDLGRNRTAA